MNKDDMLRVGVICNTHGVHGEVKVFPTTDDPSRFEYLKTVFLDTKKELVELNVTGVKYFKNLVILKFKEFDTLNDVERLKQMDLLVTRENAVPLGEGEYFVCDLLGLDVYEDTDDKTPLGVLDDILENAVNNVYVIKTPDNKEILVPAIDDCKRVIDLENKRITVHLLPGMK